MSFRGLEGKVALVTGGAGAIGVAIVARLIEEGCNVVAVDRDETALEKLAQIAGADRLQTLAADLSTQEGAQTGVRRAVEVFGGVDLLANAVGILGKSGPITELTVEDFDLVYAVNVRGIFLTMQSALRQMIAQKRGGSIVNFASVAALKARADRSLYGASKRAVVALSLSAFQAAPPQLPPRLAALADDSAAARAFDYMALKAEGADLRALSVAAYLRGRIDADTQRRDIEGIEHHLSPETVELLADLVAFFEEESQTLQRFLAFRASSSCADSSPG